MKIFFKCLGKLGCITLICFLVPVIFMVLGGILGIMSFFMGTLGTICIILFPGIIIGIIIGNLTKEK